ncbi:MAG: hypothetical protein NC333_05580, partial [Terasakiella sp.]|nr:hypothetical protein [Terasakiella sp.]
MKSIINSLLPLSARRAPSATQALVPVAALLAGIMCVIISMGADAVNTTAPIALAGASLIAVAVAARCGSLG